MKWFRWINQANLKTTLISAVSSSLWDGVTNSRHVTEEEHNVFFKIGAGEGKNQIRQIYCHLVSVCFFYICWLLAYIPYLPELFVWLSLWLFCQHVIIKDYKDWTIMTIIIFTEYYFSKQISQQNEKKCHFNNQSTNYNASSWADRSKYHDRELSKIDIVSLLHQWLWSTCEAILGDVCTFRTVTYWIWIDLKILL